VDIQNSNMEFGMIVYFYITILSVLGFILMGRDKKSAEDRRSRVSENQLMFISILGGSVGILIGMLIFKHKTSKKKFYIGIPGIYILQWAFLFGLLYYNLSL